VATTPDELLAATRQAIADETAFDARAINRNFDYDYEAYGEVKRNLGRLVASGQLRLAMQLALDLMKRGSHQVGMSDEGLMAEDIPYPPRAEPLASFNRAPVWVPPFGLVPAITLARSVSEGNPDPRLRFGLVFPECHPALNRAISTRHFPAPRGRSGQPGPRAENRERGH
jgi:hypothetical protein